MSDLSGNDMFHPGTLTPLAEDNYSPDREWVCEHPTVEPHKACAAFLHGRYSEGPWPLYWAGQEWTDAKGEALRKDTESEFFDE